jgi:hypothetical protein
MRPLLGTLLLLVAAGCDCAGRVDGPPDGSTLTDGGMRDGGGLSDAGPTDGGSVADAGELDGGVTDGGADGGSLDGGAMDAGSPSVGRLFFESDVQPAVAQKCGSCHLGVRFAFASLARAGTAFTAAETDRNYQVFLDLLSLDQPKKSRLLAKALPPNHADATPHVFDGGALQPADATYNTLLQWAQREKADRCPGCGAAAPKQYVAYVEAPALNWALARDPIRSDHGLRSRAKIMLQPIDPLTFTPKDAPIEFLPASFCGADGRCDFGNLAASHAGDRLAFECRLSPTAGKDWVNDVRWNLCIAEIGADGKAVNPRFLLPPALRHEGDTTARTDPFGLFLNGAPLKGPYDMHFRYRRRDDKHPVFSPDDSRIYYSTKSAEPRGGDDGSTAYHGTDLRNHIVSVKIDGTDRRTIYLNEGGEADFPFFLRNGNVAFHTWNLDRMDRHLYTQATADGMQEIPVLFGRVQGENMWGKATQLANGRLLGMTGSRRASVDNFILFSADHTLGTSTDPAVYPFENIDQNVFNQVLPFPNGYCIAPPEGSSCFVDRFYAEPSYSPDGRAFISHNPEKTYVQQGEDLFLNYSGAPPLADQLTRLAAYVPKKMGIWLADQRGQLEKFLDPPTGKMLRSPEWIGPRAPQRIQPSTVDETKNFAELHITDVPVWLSFRQQDGTTAKTNLMTQLDTIVALRVLLKDGKGTACINDARPYRFAVPGAGDDHPTALGMNNATGFKRLAVPISAGGDAFGDLQLPSDKSAFLKLPSNRLLLFQGINANGHVVIQHERLFALPPGVRVDTGVKRSQYRAQCSSCHGELTDPTQFKGLSQVASLAALPMDFATQSSAKASVDLTSIVPKDLSFLGTMRPILDAKCTSCHSGATPGGELSLEKTFSTTGNYPKGKWASGTLSDANYRNFIPSGSRVPAYNYSMAYSWVFKEDEQPYVQSTEFAPKIAAHAPLAELAPWDPGYQNLFANDGTRYIYLSSFLSPNFGRADRIGGSSSDSWLIEILTGRDIDKSTRVFSQTPDHRTLLTDAEVRAFMAVIDIGFPYMSRCDDKLITSGPNAGKPWGDPNLTP